MQPLTFFQILVLAIVCAQCNAPPLQIRGTVLGHGHNGLYSFHTSCTLYTMDHSFHTYFMYIVHNGP